MTLPCKVECMHPGNQGELTIPEFQHHQCLTAAEHRKLLNDCINQQHMYMYVSCDSIGPLQNDCINQQHVSYVTLLVQFFFKCILHIRLPVYKTYYQVPFQINFATKTAYFQDLPSSCIQINLATKTTYFQDLPSSYISNKVSN